MKSELGKGQTCIGYSRFSIRINWSFWEMGLGKKLEKHHEMKLGKQKVLSANISENVRANTKPFDQHLDEEYGQAGTENRDHFEIRYQAFELGCLLKKHRKEAGLTQQQLADKCATTKSYISRIENDASDIRLTTLIRIIQLGLGKKLSLTIH